MVREVDDLKKLSGLIHERNLLEREITKLIGRPAQIGHLGEYIASKVFDIDLHESASNKGFDGGFSTGPLAGCTANIKWYAMREGILDITPDALPDYYLVLTGPQAKSSTSSGGRRPWLIKNVYLFDAQVLVSKLSQCGVKIGIATSVRSELWQSAEIYPTPVNHALRLTDKQKELLGFFGSDVDVKE